jgi:hypothetical protein
MAMTVMNIIFSDVRHAVWCKLTDVSKNVLSPFFLIELLSLNSKKLASRLLLWMSGTLSSEVRRPGQKAGKSPYCTDNIMNESSYTSTLHKYS